MAPASSSLGAALPMSWSGIAVWMKKSSFPPSSTPCTALQEHEYHTAQISSQSCKRELLEQEFSKFPKMPLQSPCGSGKRRQYLAKSGVNIDQLSQVPRNFSELVSFGIKLAVRWVV